MTAYYLEDADGLVPVGDVTDWMGQEAAERAALALSLVSSEIYRVYEGVTLVSLAAHGALWTPGDYTTEKL